jgi:hypothetical protein
MWRVSVMGLVSDMSSPPCLFTILSETDLTSRKKERVGEGENCGKRNTAANVEMYRRSTPFPF